MNTPLPTDLPRLREALQPWTTDSNRAERPVSESLLATALVSLIRGIEERDKQLLKMVDSLEKSLTRIEDLEAKIRNAESTGRLSYGPAPRRPSVLSGSKS